jgi:hypothetical protein
VGSGSFFDSHFPGHRYSAASLARLISSYLPAPIEVVSSPGQPAVFVQQGKASDVLVKLVQEREKADRKRTLEAAAEMARSEAVQYRPSTDSCAFYLLFLLLSISIVVFLVRWWWCCCCVPFARLEFSSVFLI